MWFVQVATAVLHSIKCEILLSYLTANAASVSFLKKAPLSATSPATDAAPSDSNVVRDACPVHVTSLRFFIHLSITHMCCS